MLKVFSENWMDKDIHFHSLQYQKSYMTKQLGKKNKQQKIGKEEVKPSLLTDDMITYIQKTSKTPPKKLLEPINEFSKVAGQTVKTENQQCCYMPTVNYLKKKSRSIISNSDPHIQISTNKYNKRDLYNKHYRTLMKETVEGTKKWKDISSLFMDQKNHYY